MDYASTLQPIIVLFLKYFAVILSLIFAMGMVAGLFTYGKPQRRTRKNQQLADIMIGLGEAFTHALIARAKGEKKELEGTWLEDTQILAMMRGMNPTEFEQFITEMFVALGYAAEHNGGANDGGVDVVLTKDGRTSLVQCKKFITQKVNPHDVRDFYGAMGSAHINGKGIFITTNVFTLEAEKFAEDKSMELIDGTELVALVRRSGVLGTMKEKPAQDMVTTTEVHQECPRCKMGNLVLRTSSKNGSKFYGCSSFPKCHFTKDA